MSKRPRQFRDSDHWLLKTARQWGSPVDLSNITPDYYKDLKERQRRRQEREIQTKNQVKSD